MTHIKKVINLTFIIDPMWTELESFSMFKEALGNLNYNNININDLSHIKTFKEFFEFNKRLSLDIILAHLTYGCYITHKGLKRNTLIKLNIKVTQIQEKVDLPIKYKSFRCTEEEIDKRKYYLTNQLLHLTEIIDTNEIYDK